MNQEELSEVRRDLKYNIKFWVIERFEDDVESYFIELLDHIDSQAEQIKRLEAERAVWIKHYQDNRKKHAALKKLGEMVRARGEALVEERAMDDAKLPELCDIVHDELMCPALDGDCEHWEGCPRKDEMRKAARKQLRAEGVIR